MNVARSSHLALDEGRWTIVSIATTYLDLRFKNRRHFFWYGAPIEDIWVSTVIKIIVIRQVRMSPALRPEREDKHARNAARRAKIVDAFHWRLFLRIW